MPKIWMCEPSALEEYLKSIAMVSKISMNLEQSFADRYMADQSRSISTRVGRTAVINVSGILSESGPSMLDYFCGIGGTSYRKIREEVGAAENDGEVDDKLIIFDTPGGFVDGEDETWKAIRDGKKPTYGLIAGMCASAGYSLASACKTIVARSPASWIGSIGVVVTDVDDTEYFKKQGIYIVEVTSDNAPKKRLSPLSKDGKEELKKTVNAYERQFHKRIQEGRGITREKIIKDFGKGAMFVALDPDPKEQDALSRGMIDAVENGFEEEAKQGNQTNGLKSEAKKTIGRNTKEKKMNLEELLKENPGLSAEIAKRIDAAVKEALNAERNKNSQAAKLIVGNGYGASMDKLFARVVSGESSFEALETAVTTIDAINEQNRVDEAADEQEEVGAVDSGTPVPRVDGASGDDVTIKTEADIEAAAAALH